MTYSHDTRETDLQLASEKSVTISSRIIFPTLELETGMCSMETQKSFGDVHEIKPFVCNKSH